MWAMIPMLRVRESGNSRIASPPLAPLAFRSTAVSVTTISSFHSCGSAGAQLGTPTSSSASPAVMGEGLVGLGHLVGVLLTLDRGAGAVGGVQQLTGQAVCHGLLTPVPRELHQPAQRQRGRARLAHLDRHLVGGAADAAAARLQHRPGVLDRPLDRGHRIVARLLFSQVAATTEIYTLSLHDRYVRAV